MQVPQFLQREAFDGLSPGISAETSRTAEAFMPGFSLFPGKNGSYLP